MIIHTIYINHFGKWSSLELSLSPHWTSIQGENESGKSTLNDFIMAMLFGFKKVAKKRELSDDAGGYLIIEVDDVQYKVERYRHQHRGRATVIRLPEHELVGNEDVLADLIKVNEREAEAIYMLDAFSLNSQQITEDEWQGYVLSYAVSGSNTLFELEKKYQSALRPYYKTRGKPGLIQQALQEKLEYENQISKLELEDAQRDFISDYDYERKIAEKVRLDDQVQYFDEYQALSRNVQHKISAVDLTAIEQKLNAWENINPMKDKVDAGTFQLLKQRYTSLQQAVKHYQVSQKKKQWMEEELESWKKADAVNRYDHIAKLSGYAFLVIGLVTGFFSHLWLGFFACVIGVILVFYHHNIVTQLMEKTGCSDSRYDERQLEKALHRTFSSPDELARYIEEERDKMDLTPYIQAFSPYIEPVGTTLKEQLAEIKRGMRLYQQKLRQSQGVSGVDTVEKVEKLKEELRHYQGVNTESLAAAKDSLRQLQQQFQTQLQQQQRFNQLETYFPDGIEGITKEQLLQERDKLEWDIEQIKKRQKAQSNLPQHSLQELYQLQSHAKTKLHQYMKEYQKLQLKINWLRDIKESTKMDQLPMILRRCSRYFYILTHGRYGQVLFKQNQLVVQRHDKQLESLGALSTGTRSQLIIALRLAFISLQDNVSFPVIMDEGWVFFDSRRQTQLFEVLGQYSQRYQLITFSNDDLTEYADKVIDLREEINNVK